MTTTAYQRETENLCDESSLNQINELKAKLALSKDYQLKRNILRIPNKKILQIFLNISINDGLDESSQTELLASLNTLNEL